MIKKKENLLLSWSFNDDAVASNRYTEGIDRGERVIQQDV